MIGQVYIAWYYKLKPSEYIIVLATITVQLWWFLFWSYMKFSNCEERLKWLKGASQQIWKMEEDRMRAILDEDYGKAFSLLKGIKFARAEFARVSNQLRKERKWKK